jgi:hypothetical protein
VVGSAYTPTTRLASTVLLPANITGAGGIFTFNQVGTNPLFRLSPDTTYGLTISSDAVGIRWSNTGNTGPGTAVSPTALLGYVYHTFRGSSDSGASWYVTPGVHNTVIMSVDSRIFAEHMAYASKPYDTGFKGGTLQVDVPGSFSQSYDTGTGGYIDGNGLNAVFTGMFSGAGDLSFINSAAGGAVTLAGTSTYTGATHVGANRRGKLLPAPINQAPIDSNHPSATPVRRRLRLTPSRPNSAGPINANAPGTGTGLAPTSPVRTAQPNIFVILRSLYWAP